MATQRYINTRIWSDTWFELLDSDEKLLWLYLLTNQQTNLIGIYEIGIRRISFESGIEINRLQTVMKRFQTDRKAFHTDGFIVIPAFLKNQNLANKNMVTSATRLFSEIPKSVKKLLQSLGINDFESLKKGLVNGLQTVDKPLPNGFIVEYEVEDEYEEEIESEAENDSVPESCAPVPLEVSMFRTGLSDSVPPSKSEPEQPPEKKKKVPPKKKEIPTLEEFLTYAEFWMNANGKDFIGKKVQIQTKYQAWKENGWKDGNGKPIKNWKTKFQSTEPYLKADYHGNNSKTTYSTSAAKREAREPQPGTGFGKL